MFLSEAGRLQMTNAVFTSLPMFHLGTYLLPKTVIDQIDKYRKHCFWRGSNINAKGPPKAAWKIICLPKGGPGVLNLKTQNEALVLKIFINSLIKWILPRCNWYGRNIIEMVGCLLT